VLPQAEAKESTSHILAFSDYRQKLDYTFLKSVFLRTIFFEKGLVERNEIAVNAEL
jgi:hypothetical protein